MEKEFVPYELAVKLKALGFDEPCFAFYICKGHPVMIDEIRNGKCFDSDESEGCLAPTFSQAFRWFREKYTLAGYSFPNALGSYGFTIVTLSENHHSISSKMFDTNEEAELACLDRLIEMVESKKSTTVPGR